MLAGYNDLASLRPDMAREWHPTKNGNLTPGQVTISSGQKVWWECPDGHEWDATIATRSKGHGCPVHAGQQVLAGYNDLASLRSDMAREWHPTKNGNLTPGQVTISSNKRVWWACEEGHEWDVPVKDRTKGSGCPDCRIYGTSRDEVYLAYELELFTPMVRNARILGLGKLGMPDIMLPELNVCVEYDGSYHHGFEGKLENDRDKTEAMESVGWGGWFGSAKIRLRRLARRIWWAGLASTSELLM